MQTSHICVLFYWHIYACVTATTSQLLLAILWLGHLVWCILLSLLHVVCLLAAGTQWDIALPIRSWHLYSLVVWYDGNGNYACVSIAVCLTRPIIAQPPITNEVALSDSGSMLIKLASSHRQDRQKPEETGITCCDSICYSVWPSHSPNASLPEIIWENTFHTLAPTLVQKC